MTYQVLARKWRPKDFSSLVGQDHVVTALRNGLEEGRIAQAYLFSGIRGVGKTTAARVLAKALNCERGPTGDPCGECSSCLGIVEGSNLDVLEIDAATYSKVEQVRELTESLRYGPTGRYKVVVLDEIHRLSRQAFDALLKIVEEPPAHLVFVFATTEKDAVPATLLSRCQEHSFRRVPSGTLAAHLRTIAEAESIEVADSALRLIARAGEGSVRDSVSLLDQMATFGGGTIDDAAAAALLGGLDAAVFHRLLGAMTAGDAPTVVEQVAEIETNGWDPQSVYGQFLGYLRDALHAAMGGGAGAIDLPREEAEALAETARQIGHEPILQILQLLLRSEPTVRRSEHGALALEIAWLRAAELPKLVRIQDLLAGGPIHPAAPQDGARADRPSGSRSAPPRQAPSQQAPSQQAPSQQASRQQATPRPRARRDAAEPAAAGDEDPSPARAAGSPGAGPEREDPQKGGTPPSPQGTESTPAEPTTLSPSVSSDPPEASLDLDPARIPALFEILSTRRQSLAALFRDAVIEVDGASLVVKPRPGDHLLAQALDRPRNAEAFSDAVRQAFGTAVPFRLVAPAPLARDRAPAPSGRGDRGDSADDRSERPRSSGTRSSRARGDRSQGSPPGEGRPGSGQQRRGDSASPSQGAGRASGNPRAVESGFEGVRDQPVVAAVLATFGGKIRRVVDPSSDAPPTPETDDAA